MNATDCPDSPTLRTRALVATVQAPAWLDRAIRRETRPRTDGATLVTLATLLAAVPATLAAVGLCVSLLGTAPAVLGALLLSPLLLAVVPVRDTLRA